MVLKTDSALEKWLAMEFQNINRNTVKTQASMATLIKMETPTLTTKSGEEYIFDNPTLDNFAKAVPKLYHNRLKLPIYVYKDLRVKDSCFIIDDVAAKVLHLTKDLDSLYEFKDGKLWMSRPIVHDIAKKYPTLFQFIVY
jgi:uncharacterized protein (UPF0216 family)